MRICRYCGKDAGWFRNVHSECDDRFKRSRSEIVSLVSDSILNNRPMQALPDQIRQVAIRGFIDPQVAQDLTVEGWNAALEKALDNGILSVEEEKQLSDAARQLQIDTSHLNRQEVMEKIAMARAIREVLNGEIPQYPFPLPQPLSLNLQKSEEIVWLFNNVPFLEERTQRQFVGGTQGVSIRIARGVYYRVGGFRGRPVESTSMERIDTGLVAFTTKHIYFAGARNAHRTPYRKIVSFQPYSDGIGVLKEGVRARLQTYITGNGWFTYNLVTNLASRVE